ncbi:hypothetical protein FHP05_08515 [Cerasibacillus terrae]|uniref:Uncharacterized protein n=1 Tax=Cerasibacillus terrae TaxID=2498845 RepID=A0A5C8NTD7_9BACI|nr:hypothetical protein [Cerasibacillus terrae]TXL64362.1 hypothetical protein FHP05_08515 [Cerasibacillus terrae]
MKKAIEVFKDMKSVMIFDPEDSQEETNRKWGNWWNHNQKSAVLDKAVPGVEETWRMLHGEKK